jgi:hypothetical protein
MRGGADSEISFLRSAAMQQTTVRTLVADVAGGCIVYGGSTRASETADASSTVLTFGPANSNSRGFP